MRQFRRQEGNGKQADEWPVRVEDEHQAEVSAEPEPTDAEPLDRAARDLGGVGEHIASVLAAAEAAAEKLRSEAEEEARTMLRGAERQAHEIRESARTESEGAHVSAQQLLEEAQARSADVQAQADNYADERRRQADTQAAKVVLEAERKAASIADTANERHRVVLSNIATSEARLRDLAKSLRGVASALDTVVGDETAAEAPAPVVAKEGASLEESLRARTGPRSRSGGSHP